MTQKQGIEAITPSLNKALWLSTLEILEDEYRAYQRRSQAVSNARVFANPSTAPEQLALDLGI
jgi:hypothetical protein